MFLCKTEDTSVSVLMLSVVLIGDVITINNYLILAEM